MCSRDIKMYVSSSSKPLLPSYFFCYDALSPIQTKATSSPQIQHFVEKLNEKRFGTLLVILEDEVGGIITLFSYLLSDFLFFLYLYYIITVYTAYSYSKSLKRDSAMLYTTSRPHIQNLMSDW